MITILLRVKLLLALVFLLLCVCYRPSSLIKIFKNLGLKERKREREREREKTPKTRCVIFFISIIITYSIYNREYRK